VSKILVTGATGFIGNSLVPVLVKSGHIVRCSVWRKSNSIQAEQIIVNNLVEQMDWTEALNDIDIVIHLAARVHYTNENILSSSEEYYKVNSLATKNFAEQAAKKGVKRFIFLSSIKVNGEFSLENKPFTEESSMNARDPYALSKLYAESYLQKISCDTGMQIVILRPPLVYGPNVKANFLNLIKLVDQGWPLPFAKLKNKRSLIYIDNLISAICAVITDKKAANQLFLVSDDESWTLSELVRALGEGLNRRTKLFSVPVVFLIWMLNILRRGHISSRLFTSLEVSNNKIKTQLGWIPPVRSKDGIVITAKWYQYECNS